MYTSRVLKILFVPAAVVVVEEKLQEKYKKDPKLCRPSDLPIYVPESTPPVPEPEKREPGGIPATIEEGFATVRQHVTHFYDEAKAYQKVGLQYFEQSRDNAEWLIQYLREEDNTTPKAGAIGIGGLTGLIFGLRGGLIKRTIYTATGALAMAAVCYPKEASEYSQIAIAESRKFATIAYNFAYGGGDTDKQVKVTENDSAEGHASEIDAQGIVIKAHDESTSKSCHCPVGTCTGHHDEAITT